MSIDVKAHDRAPKLVSGALSTTRPNDIWFRKGKWAYGRVEFSPRLFPIIVWTVTAIFLIFIFRLMCTKWEKNPLIQFQKYFYFNIDRRYY